MSECSGNPNNCNFCGVSPSPPHLVESPSNIQNTKDNCAKDSVNGCSANPSSCTVCQGKGCVAVECTGYVPFPSIIPLTSYLSFSYLSSCESESANEVVTSRHARHVWETSRLVGSLRYRLLRVLRGFDLLPMLRACIWGIS